MTTIRITFAALALSACAFAQASEITEFPIPTSSTLTRAEVKAEAARHFNIGSMSINFAGPEVKAPFSTKSREEVLEEIAASRRMENVRVTTAYFVGGM
jgi:Domain of unknown function (DUF4148)